MTKHLAPFSIFRSVNLAILAVSISFALSNSVNAQLVFEKSAIDGSFGQPSILDANVFAYGLQPFAVTSALASAGGIEYSAAFSAEPVEFAGGNLTGLDVRTWVNGIFYLSNLADALNGTPTARMEFNPLESTAPNGQQFQELITMQQGPNGETHYTFTPVADLGSSIDGNPFHQLTETFEMDTTITLQDNSTTTLGEFLTSNVGQTLYAGSIINNAAINGSYDIPITPNLGLNGVIYDLQVGQEVEAGFAHWITPLSSVLLGDINLDGDVTFADIAPFITILAAGTFQDEADLDENGDVNFSDIAPFITVLSSQ